MLTTIDRIINELSNGNTLSAALATIYTKRKVSIPYKKQWFDVDVRDIHMEPRIVNSLMRAKLTTLNKLMDYIEDDHKPVDIRNLGFSSAKRMMEVILDYAWSCMNDKEKAEFLIDIVVMNERYLKAE